MEIIISDDMIQTILLVFGIIMALVTTRYRYYYVKIKSAITEARILLMILEDVLSDDKVTPEELKTKILPAFRRLKKLYG
ncbi:MAG: hypothetical protein IBX39_09265 [Candidatus Methanoperedenaceae archaeon]|nr:hypothetical protein [Candidatus Methanoperedenaceae archaeon]